MNTLIFAFIAITEAVEPASPIPFPASVQSGFHPNPRHHDLKFRNYVSGLAELPWTSGGEIEGRICDTASDATLISLVHETLIAATKIKHNPTLSLASADPRSTLSQLVRFTRAVLCSAMRA
jgi:hypothetical protein